MSPERMTSTPNRVLDYAPSRPRRVVWRWIIPLIVVGLGGIAGTAAGVALTPVRYRAVGFLQVAPPDPWFNLRSFEMSRGAKRLLLQRLTSPMVQVEIESAFVSAGISRHVARKQAQAVQYKDIPESRLIRVAAIHSTAPGAASLANIAIRAGCNVGTVTPEGGEVHCLQVIRRPLLPDFGFRNPVPIAIGGAIGTSVGVAGFCRFRTKLDVEESQVP